MANKKIINLATEEYVNNLVEQIELLEGKSAYDLAVENGFEGSKEEWIASLKGEIGPQGEQGIQGEKGEQGEQGPQGATGTFDAETSFEALQTEDKTVIGAINELYQMINNWMNPIYDIKSQMFYGILNPAKSGVIKSYSEITLDMLNSEDSVKSTKPGERIPLSLGIVQEGTFIVIAIPALYDYKVTKDNGFGSKIPFDESVIGANGIDIEFDGVDYRVYGEFALVTGERIVYIEKPEESTGGSDCECYDITIEDINEAISEMFK